MSEKKNENKKAKKIINELIKKKEAVTEGITYIECPIHHIRYPKGSSCPKCK
ncbi:MAG: hypothetical protein ACTSUC_00350 [Promethearchaeota archaeon]